MKLSLLALAAVLACGCATAAPAPHESLASAMDTLRSATALGVSGEAEDRMRRAKVEIDRAIGLMHEGKNEEAQRLLTRANVDAELALELGRENVMMRRARDAKAAALSARQGE
ncbi:MAG TPA: DUF4398 domain-containing protein [Polyangiaceae bacterium]